MKHLLNRVPYPYQIEDVDKIQSLDGRVLNASDMGTGKSYETILSLKQNPKWLPALVVCPASVKFNWQIEAQAVGFNASVCESRTPPKRGGWRIPSQITVINYDILPYWVDHLKQYGMRTLICDECQNLTHPTTLRTKTVRDLSKHFNHLMFLSGTPLTNRPVELFPVLQMLWPQEFKTFHAFAQRYCDPKWIGWLGRWDYKGSSNLPELHQRLKNLGMIRRRKHDVLKDLPEKVRRIVPCEMSDPKQYQEATADFIGWMKRNNPSKARSASRALALTKIGYLLQLCARLKFRGVVNWANQFMESSDEKLVLFAHHHDAIDVLKRRVVGKKVIIDGNVTGRLRQAAVEQFQRDSKTRLCLGSLAASIGVNLQVANNLGFCEFWWRPGDHAQAEDRICRIGQTKTSWINYFVALGTIEERLCEVLQEKQKVISTVLDGGTVVGDLNILEILLDEISQNPKRILAL